MKRGTPRHPKVGRLCDELNINTPTAVGLLELLWHFTAEFAPQGDIGKYTDNRIEAGCLSWFRPKGKLILALIKTGWIDQDPVSRLVVHDWHDHADDSVRKKLQRHDLEFLSLTSKVTGQRPATQSDGVRRPIQSNPSQAYPEPGQSQMDNPPLRQKPAKTVGDSKLPAALNGDLDFDEDLRQTLSLWKLAFPAGIQQADLYKLKAELRHVPSKVFCAHLDAMKKVFQPGGNQEPTTLGFFISTARNLAKDYPFGGDQQLKAKLDAMTDAIELPGRTA